MTMTNIINIINICSGQFPSMPNYYFPQASEADRENFQKFAEICNKYSSDKLIKILGLESFIKCFDLSLDTKTKDEFYKSFAEDFKKFHLSLMNFFLVFFRNDPKEIDRQFKFHEIKNIKNFEDFLKIFLADLESIKLFFSSMSPQNNFWRSKDLKVVLPLIVSFSKDFEKFSDSFVKSFSLEKNK